MSNWSCLLLLCNAANNEGGQCPSPLTGRRPIRGRNRRGGRDSGHDDIVRMRTIDHGGTDGGAAGAEDNGKRRDEHAVGARENVRNFLAHVGNRLVSDFGFGFYASSVIPNGPAPQIEARLCQRKIESSNKKHIKRDTASFNTGKSSVFLHRPYTELKRIRNFHASARALIVQPRVARSARGTASTTRNRVRSRDRNGSNPDRRRARRRCRA